MHYRLADYLNKTVNVYCHGNSFLKVKIVKVDDLGFYLFDSKDNLTLFISHSAQVVMVFTQEDEEEDKDGSILW